MLIAETFYSLQGEGELTGVPSFFIRTSGCNLRCAWCDTPYASWQPEGAPREVADLVDEVRRTPARHVVLTGGEPMIAKEIHGLAAALREARYHVTIETAGTVAPAGIACDLVSLSPKLLNSAPDAAAHPEWRRRHEAARWQPAVIRAWLEGGYGYQFKFVITRPTDVDELEAMLAKVGRPIPPPKVLLMPEGTTLARLRERAPWLSELCKERGYRYAHRLHVELYGHRRGT